MNHPCKAILIATFAGAVQLTAPASQAQDNLTISCAARHLASQQAVAKALDLHNFGQAYSARDKLMRYVHRACVNGAGQVVVINGLTADPQPTWSHTRPRIADAANQAARSKQH
jgi:hypothetical protein